MNYGTSSKSPSQALPAATSTAKVADLKSIELRVVVWSSQPPGNYYVKLRINKDVMKVPIVSGGNSVTWNISISFDNLHGSPMLELGIYRCRWFPWDKSICGAKTTIELLHHLADRETGVHILRKAGKMHEAMGEFRLLSFAMADEASRGKLNEIVSKAKDVTTINPAPSLITDAVDCITSTADTVNPTTAAWDPLLDNIRLFTKIVDGIPQIHLDAIMALSILSDAHKRIIAQKDGVDMFNRLAESIGDTYAFVHLAEPLKRIESQKSIFITLTAQTIQCAYFISEYVKNKDLWKQTVNNLASNIDNKVKQYQDMLNKLRLEIQEHANTKIPLPCFPTVWDSSQGIQQDDTPDKFIRFKLALQEYAATRTDNAGGRVMDLVDDFFVEYGLIDRPTVARVRSFI